MKHVHYGDGVADSALIMLAGLILARVRLNLPNETRAQALAIIKGVKAPPSKDRPFVASMKGFRRLSEPCILCKGPVFYGEPCRICFSGEITQHIECPKTSDELEALYAECIQSVTSHQPR